MLREIANLFEHPEDVPEIPDSSAQYLKARLSHAYFSRAGYMDSLRKQGYSEQFILGFIEGMAAGVEVVEAMQDQRHRDNGED